jgi:cell division protein FtsN
MTRDYRTPRRRARGSGGILLIGLLIGLVMGVGIAAAVAVYVNHMPNPFAQKPLAAVEPRAKPDTGGLQKPLPIEATGPTAEGAGAKRFTFYEDLPKGNQPVGPGQEPKPETERSAPQDKPAAQGERPAGGEPDDGQSALTKQADKSPGEDIAYYVQTGAFQNEEEADNQKANIALIGYEARIRPTDTPDRGRMHRVRVGPFSSMDEVNEVVQALKQNGIGATIIRAAKTPPAKPGAAPAAANN